MAILLEAKSLTKHYGQTIAPMSVDFQVHNGITGLLGPNGAGKTTLFRMITGEVEPDAGHLRIGESVRLGFVEQLYTFGDAGRASPRAAPWL